MPLKLKKRDGIWYYSGTVAGERIRRSAKTADKEAAEQIAAQAEQTAWQRHLHGPASVITFAQAAVLYRKAGKQDRFLSRIEDYWKNTPIRKITQGAIRQSAIVLYPGTSGATMNRQVIVPTQAIINFAAELDLCPRISVKRFPVEKKEKEPATWEWVQEFMAHANPHLGALACFMMLTGARITEALSVEWSDVDLNARRARINQTKVGKERWAHLPAPLVAAIANIEGREGKVFRYSSRATAKIQWNKAIRRAGIEHRSFHACRHGFATALLHKGVDPITVSKRGGWSTPEHVFRTYGHASEDPTVTDLICEPNVNPRAQSNDVAEIAKLKQKLG